MTVYSPYAKRFINRTADPATGVEGQVYWKSDTNKLRVYDGSAWGDVGSAGTVTGTGTTGQLVKFTDGANGIIGNSLVTLAGPTVARTVTLPDANFTVARTDAAQTFTGTQTVGGLIQTGGTGITAAGGVLVNTSNAIISVGYAATHTVGVSSVGTFGFALSPTDGTSALDTGIARGAAGVVRLSNGSTGAGGLSSVANSPTQLTGNVNDYSPGVGIFQRWSSDASRNVTGMVAGAEGAIRFIWNVGAQNIVLVNQSASSAAANRFTTSTGADLTLGANKCALAQYDLTSTTWRVTLLP